MNAYENKLKRKLFSIIDEMGTQPQNFVYDPDKNYTRNRKLGFADFIKFSLSMGAKSTNSELLEYFNYSKETPSSSAYNQQKAKVKPETFKYLLDKFTDVLPQQKTYCGYRLIACDGSEINISRGKKGDDTFVQCGNNKGYSLMHVSVFYDLLNELYLDEIISTNKEMNEKAECITMIDRSKYEKVLLLADRGYENYNLFAHAIEKDWKYLIRVKDIDKCGGIVNGCILGLEGEFDVSKDIIITRRNTKYEREHKDIYKRMINKRKFDFIPLGDKENDYPMNLRIVRIKINDNNYEVIITNLDKDKFPAEEIKKLYHMRWGVETSFRELKYYVGMRNFHAKKPDYISQEIYSRLIIYNFCKNIINRINIKDKYTKIYDYKLNTSAAISICRHFLFGRYAVPPDIEMLLLKYLTPIRPYRSFPRKVANQKPVSLNYKPA